MADARNVDGPQQEFQLETRHLVLLIALVLVLCVASFMLGRWVERQSLGPAIAGSAAGGKSGDAEVADMGDVSKDLTFFDTLEGNKPAPLEPPTSSRRSTTPVKPRTAATARTGADTASPPSVNPRRSVNEGVMIQVFASKDRAAADAIRRRLRSKGYTALLVPDRGTYKVRVGPYADREEATRAADILREQEKLTTWIP
jgi:cell division septation protein DedD